MSRSEREGGEEAMSNNFSFMQNAFVRCSGGHKVHCQPIISPMNIPSTDYFIGILSTNHLTIELYHQLITSALNHMVNRITRVKFDDLLFVCLLVLEFRVSFGLDKISTQCLGKSALGLGYHISPQTETKARE